MTELESCDLVQLMRLADKKGIKVKGFEVKPEPFIKWDDMLGNVKQSIINLVIHRVKKGG
jgi:hypothetical protein